MSVVEQYLEALRADQAVLLQQFAVDVAQTELEASAQWFEAGTISASQFTQTQIALQKAETELTNAQLTSAQALLNLSTTLGVQVDSVENTVLDIALPKRS